MTNIIYKDGIEKSIKTAYSAARLPRDIDFTMNNKILYVCVKNPCLNMQENGAAFEAWIIMLKSHLDIDKVVLDFDSNKKDTGHYNRFLWRVSNFAKMYSWFEIDPTKKQIVNNFLAIEFVNLKVNKPSVIRPPVTNSTGERYIEWLFASQKPNTLQGVLECNLIVNQFPIGVFNDAVTNKTKLFTGGASAIDLLGIDDINGILHIIELKKGDNYSIGIISEFLFYTFVLYNIFISKTIMYETGAIVVPDFEKLRNMHLNQIQGHLLAERFHPLIDKKTMLLLNSGLKVLNVKANKLIYHYDKFTCIISGIKFAV